MISVVYFGTPEFSSSFLQFLYEDDRFNVIGVVCQPDRPQGRKKILTAPPTKVYAQQHNIPVYQPASLKKERLELQADVFVVVAYGNLLPQYVLDQPTYGTINVHPSLLPKYRGPSPMQAAIANQEPETGVSIMLLDEKMDHGPILAQETITLTPEMTVPTLTETVVHVGAPLLADAIAQYVAGTLQPQPQNHDAATFCKLLSREDGVIDWNATAESIDAKVRAYTPWPGTTATINDQPVKLHQVRVSDESDLEVGDTSLREQSLYLGTSTANLELITVQPPGKKPMTGQAFFNGLQH